MPELPEVETTKRGIADWVQGQPIKNVVVRQRKLRWAVPDGLEQALKGHEFTSVTRRAKYLIFTAEHGAMLLHLGMSGSLRVLPATTPAQKHDHVDIVFASGQLLRFTDPRRFGSIHWTTNDPVQHPLLVKLGPEPLEDAFTGKRLSQLAKGRRVSVKQFIMDGHVVVGVGNIYASEALFAAGINPKHAASNISAQRFDRLAAEIKRVIAAAIDAGGTTLRDFTQVDGKPGYFRIQLAVYGRAGEPCPKCTKPLAQMVLGQRSTFYCSQCQH